MNFFSRRTVTHYSSFTEKKGYANVGINYETQRQGGQATVVFNISEEQKIKIRKVEFEVTERFVTANYVE